MDKEILIAEETADVQHHKIVGADTLFDRLDSYRNIKQSGIEMPWAKTHGRVMLRPKELVLMGGYSGHFKSTIAAQIAFSAVEKGENVGIASLELPAEEIIEQFAEFAADREKPPLPFVEKMTAKISPFLHVYDVLDVINPEVALQMTIALARDKECKLIILDALMMMGASDDYNQEQKFSQRLAAIAKRYNTCIVLIHHVRKPDGQNGEGKIPGKYEFIGSSHLANISSTIITVWHDKEKAYMRNTGQEHSDSFDDSKPDLVLFVCKQRNHKFEGKLGLWQSHRSRTFCETYHRKTNPRIY
jgi:replicative DNA helicase